MDGFSTGGVYGRDGVVQLNEDPEPGGGGDGVGFEYCVGEAGAACGVAAAWEGLAVLVFVLWVWLPGAEDGCAEVPHACGVAGGECCAGAGVDSGAGGEGVGALPCYAEILALRAGAREDEDAFSGLV